MNEPDYRKAQSPNELERLFVRFANRKDFDGLMSLYEPDAVLIDRGGQAHEGGPAIERALARYLESCPVLERSEQRQAVRSAGIALTSSRHSDGSSSVEVARRQADGSWRWVIDQLEFPP